MGTVEIIPSAENDHRARQQGRFASVLRAGRWWLLQGHGVAISMTRRTASLDHEPGLFIHPWILEPSATGLCEPDLHVFAKLFEDRLERGLEAQAFSGREIGGDDDVLDFFVGHLVDVDLTRQPAS